MSAPAAVHAVAQAATLHLAAAKTPFIDWTSLGKVAGASAVFGIGIVVLFSVGIVGLSMARGHDVAEGATARDGGAVVPGSANRALGTGLAAVCFTVCAAAVVYGLYLIIPQFH